MGNAGIGGRWPEGQGTEMGQGAGGLPGDHFTGKAPFAFSIPARLPKNTPRAAAHRNGAGGIPGAPRVGRGESRPRGTEGQPPLPPAPPEAQGQVTGPLRAPRALPTLSFLPFIYLNFYLLSIKTWERGAEGGGGNSGEVLFQSDAFSRRSLRVRSAGARLLGAGQQHRESLSGSYRADSVLSNK